MHFHRGLGLGWIIILIIYNMIDLYFDLYFRMLQLENTEANVALEPLMLAEKDRL